MKNLYTTFKINRKLSYLMMGLLVFSLFSASNAYGQAIAINCGSDADFTAADGTVYVADVHFNGGGAANSFTGPDYTGDILGTEDDVLYQTYRKTGYTELDDHFYNIPLVNGTYSVTLKFADYQQWQRNAGHLIIEGKQLLTNYVVQDVAGKFTALDLTFIMNIVDGELNMQFINDELSVGDFFINGIKIAEHTTDYVLWSEDFTFADGTMVDDGETAWTAVRESGIHHVANNMLIINEGGTNPAEFTSEVIDISAGPVAISLDVATSNGIDDGQDFVKLYAIVDGADPVLLDSIDGEFLHGLGGEELSKGDGVPGDFGVLSGSGISGSSLQIYITSYVSAGSEFYFMDNLTVVEETLPWIEDFTLADGTTEDTGETAWTAVRADGRFEVENNTLVINEGGTNPAVFTSEEIEIFGAPVSVSLDVLCSGGLDGGQDFVRLYVIVDGGDEVLVAEQDAGSEGEALTLKGINIVGNTLTVVVKSYVSSGSENYWMDNLTVDFESITTYELIATAEHGSISLDPEKDVYEEGTEVTISVTPDYGFNFTGWEGDVTSTETSITVTMDSAINVNALFEELPTFTLTTSTENGSVFQTPQRDTYAEGEEVLLTAQPIVGYEFIEWTGDITGTENPTTVVMDANKTIAAVIALIPAYTVTVSATNGSVQLLPAKETYAPGAAVVLSATGDEGYRFKEWTGDLTGTQNPTSTIMNADLSVTANFELIPASFMLTVEASTNGSITLSPEGDTYEDGTVVTVTAVPDDGFMLEAWGGALSGSTNPSTITMDADKTVSATFAVEVGVNLASGPAESGLMQNYPNPFSSETTIPYQLNEASDVKLSIYNSLGQKVAILVNAYQPAGNYTIDWNTKQMDMGLYILRLEIGDDMVHVKRSMLIR